MNHKLVALVFLGMILLVLALIDACGDDDDDGAVLNPNNPGGNNDDDVDDDDDAADDDDDDTTSVGYRIAFIYNDDTSVTGFSALLTAYQMTLVPVHEADITSTDFSNIDALMVDDGTLWNNSANITTIKNLITTRQMPILGLYEGGGRLISNLYYNVGWAGCDIDWDVTQIIVNIATHSIFHYPNNLSLETLDRVAIFNTGTRLCYHDLLNTTLAVELLAMRPTGTGWSAITLEDSQIMFWGFETSPAILNQTGQKLLINCLHYLASGGK